VELFWTLLGHGEVWVWGGDENAKGEYRVGVLWSAWREVDEESEENWDKSEVRRESQLAGDLLMVVTLLHGKREGVHFVMDLVGVGIEVEMRLKGFRELREVKVAEELVEWIYRSLWALEGLGTNLGLVGFVACDESPLVSQETIKKPLFSEFFD
jgi:hypothetical protein